jgi:hypothetical protein
MRQWFQSTIEIILISKKGSHTWIGAAITGAGGKR